MSQGPWENGDYVTHQKGSNHTQLQPSVNLWKWDSLSWNFYVLFNRSKNLYYYIKLPAYHWDWSCVLQSPGSSGDHHSSLSPYHHCPPSIFLWNTTQKTLLSILLSFFSHCLVYWRKTLTHGLLSATPFWDTNSNIDGPFNTLAHQSLGHHKFHDISSTPP